MLWRAEIHGKHLSHEEKLCVGQQCGLLPASSLWLSPGGWARVAVRVGLGWECAAGTASHCSGGSMSSADPEPQAGVSWEANPAPTAEAVMGGRLCACAGGV